jgi:hypothetical protein
MMGAAKRAAWGAALLVLLGACDVGDEYFVYRTEPPPSGGGPPNHAPEITLIFVAPLETGVGSPVTLSGAAIDADGDPVELRWAPPHGLGSIQDPKASDTTFTCRKAGSGTITLIASDGKTERSQSVPVTCI